MTLDIFISQIKSYYGEYTGNVETYVLHYLNHDIDHDKYDKLFRYICHSHPVNYGAPDISAMETSIQNALKNTKNAIDVHKTGTTDIRDMWPVITDEEHEAGKKMLDDAGGLPGLLKGVVKTMELDGTVDRREPYVD